VATDAEFKMGITVLIPYSYETKEFGFFASIPAGIAYGWNTLVGYVSDFKYIFTKEGATSLGGFVTIGNLFSAQWDWYSFWMMTAFISIILAFMNILPIPALDGGHVLFLLVEVITRRKPSDKFMERAQIAGMIILFALMIYANLNDIIRLFF
jgi:regulator of sigma E protease